VARASETVTPAADAASDDVLVELARRVGDACRARSTTIGAAESCTGGLVAHWITEVPGSSAYFLGGVVTYSNGLKQALIDVPADVLDAHGAVSAQVARAMAVGARARLGVDLAVAVTGVAGPDGGTPDKPVGLTYVAVADGDGEAVRRFQWAGDRSANKRSSAEAALRSVLERLAPDEA
jgi:nicotinamide-nucleotide amidase